MISRSDWLCNIHQCNQINYISHCNMTECTLMTYYFCHCVCLKWCPMVMNCNYWLSIHFCIYQYILVLICIQFSCNQNILSCMVLASGEWLSCCNQVYIFFQLLINNIIKYKLKNQFKIITLYSIEMLISSMRIMIIFWKN